MNFKNRTSLKEKPIKTNLKLAEIFDSAKCAAETSNLEKVKSDLARGTAKTGILLADKSEYGWSTVEEYKQYTLADDSEDDNASTVLRDMPVQLCLLERKRSRQQWLQPKELLGSARRFCLQVPNPKLGPSSQPLPILVSCLTLVHGSLVERPGISVPVAPR